MAAVDLPGQGAGVEPADRISRHGGLLVGRVRNPENRARRVAGSIHDDATAARLGLGFRGGTVAGSVHFELFPPLLREAFGQRWFERGSLSILFRNPITDREPTRAMIGDVPAAARDLQVGAWIRRYPDGLLLGEGTAAVGQPAEPTYLRGRDLHLCDPAQLRIFAGIVPGMEEDHGTTVIGTDQVEKALAGGGLADTIDWYVGGSPWGGRIVPITLAFNMLRAPVIAAIGRRQQGSAVGLFGAIELRYVNGPVLPDTPYHVTSRIIGVGQSDRTEYCWFDAFADDAGGRRIVELTFMTRRVKAEAQAYRQAG
jgi:hypothetical protein